MNNPKNILKILSLPDRLLPLVEMIIEKYPKKDLEMVAFKAAGKTGDEGTKWLNFVSFAHREFDQKKEKKQMPLWTPPK
jgi:hypothetical protein